MLLLLFRCGDIELNPGPETVPCNISNKQLSFCHLNVRSLLQRSDIGSRFDHFHNYICRDKSYDVIALSETHLSSEIDDSEINIDDFTLFRKDRNRHGGGTALYCRSELNPILIPDLTTEWIEIIWIQISINKNKILFGSCYRAIGHQIKTRKSETFSWRVYIPPLKQFWTKLKLRSF